MKYDVNGQSVSHEEFLKHTQRRVRLHGGIAGILEDGHAPGGHAPYWGTGHNSFGAGVPPHQAEEYRVWLKEQGLSGVTVNGDGSVDVASPENWRKLLAARNLAEQTPYGTGKKRTDPNTDKPKPSAPDANNLREAAAQIRQSPRIKQILGES